jgi:HD-GYP domain-containing protein (c-di-GMP phosphodiesterase class II)
VYPDGLSGDDIPISSRITFVCDAYDAMTSDRPYHCRLPSETAREELRRGAGTQFCARCAQTLLEVLHVDAQRLAAAAG